MNLDNGKLALSYNPSFESDCSGQEMHSWARDLFPICRSTTGRGLRQTLGYIRKIIPELTIHEVPSGTRAFDWTVPDEWTIRDAFVKDESGRKIIDFHRNNLHVVSYSEPLDRWMELDELNRHLHSLPEMPEAVPYVTSCYKRGWGFCISDEKRKSLKPGRYRAVIDSDLGPGVLNYGEVILPGLSSREVFLSTYVCHPSMANNELSGPVVTTALIRWLKSQKKTRYTYRIAFIPETIGSIVYISRNLEHLKQNVVAGFNVTCVGDERCYSFLPSRDGNTLADRAALHVLRHIYPDFRRFTWLERGSDERQYCAPGVDLPVATIMRTKYGEYPEYHTSLDDLNLVTARGLKGGYEALRKAIEVIEKNIKLKTTVLCEPQLGKRGLYPEVSTRESGIRMRNFMNLISYCDGNRTLLDIAELIDRPFAELADLADLLVDNDLVRIIPA